MKTPLSKFPPSVEGVKPDTMSVFCCETFTRYATSIEPPAGGGVIYPPGMRPTAQFERDENRETWNINGCCGGGCYVVTDMRFCPFCAAPLTMPSGDAP